MGKGDQNGSTKEVGRGTDNQPAMQGRGSPGEREGSQASVPGVAEPIRRREPSAARTMIALSHPLAHQLQRPRNVSASVL